MIPTRDGTRLAADLYRPATDDAVPVVVEYTPYRKDDLRGATRDFGHFYLAARGIASLQLDVRGTGGSEGVVLDEYQHPQEQEDGYDAVEWLARQPWCNGKVGMWGTSYAGFTALQVAQLGPPSLGAIAPIYATDDRYTDDMHFRGGALNGWSVIGPYALGMVTRNAMPPYPDHGNAHWRDLWNRRLRENVPWLIRWLEEQMDGPYWQSTLGRRYDRVRVPTLIIGGWADFYVNAAVRWFTHLQVPKKLIMGPWPHSPPDAATPGAQIDFMHEVARWFTEFLKGQATGIADEPPVTVFIQTGSTRGTSDDAVSGYWRFEEMLPPATAAEHAWHLRAEGDLDPRAPADAQVAEHRYVPFAGLSGLSLPLTYTSKPLRGDVEMLGVPRIRLFASVTAEVAFFAVGLCDVAPDGSSTPVCKGLLNGTRRHGMDDAVRLSPGEITELAFDLDAASWVFSKGHCIRVTISGADFPEVWPSPLPTSIRIHCGLSQPSSITLPLVPLAPARFPPPVLLPPGARRSRFQYELEKPGVVSAYDRETGTATARQYLRETVRCPDGATVVTSEHRTEMTVSPSDPSAAKAVGWDRKTVSRPGLEVECIASAELQSTACEFHLTLDLDVALNGSPYWRRRWNRAIPRRLL
jgi:predicted acyl esterase